MLIYGILYVSEVLGKIKPGMSRREAEKVRGSYDRNLEPRLTESNRPS